MYKEIEELYKKKSPYNIIKKRMFWIYIAFIFVSLFLNIYNKIIPMIIVSLIMLFIMKWICEKALKTKLYISIKNKEKGKPLNIIIKETELNMFKEYSTNKDMYNEKSLMCIIDHYRSVIKTKIVGGNLLAILSIALPIVLSFYTKDGFDFNGLTNALPYLIIFSVMIIMMYFSFNELIEMRKFLKGEDGMEERLEEIYSELYIRYINNSIEPENQKVKKVAKKKVNKKEKASKK